MYLRPSLFAFIRFYLRQKDFPFSRPSWALKLKRYMLANKLLDR
jgi:hypothetical protein